MEMREEIKSDLLAIQRIAGTAEQKACIRTKLLQFLDIDPLHSPQISSQRLLVLLEERLLQLKQVPRCDPMLVENALNEELLLQQHDPASQQLADAIRHVLRLVAPYSTCITSPQATLIENEQAQLMRLLGGTLRPLLLDHTQSTEPIPMLTAGIQSQLMRIKWLSPHRLCAYSYTMFTKLLGQFISDRCLVNYRLLRVINCWYQALIRHFKWELHQVGGLFE
jgi:hypothetical protein